MMIRILGGILICASCGLLGLYMGYRGVVRARHLAEFKQSLLLLKSEIEFAAYALPQAFANVSQRAGDSLADFYMSLSRRVEEKISLDDAWNVGLKELKNNHLAKEDLQVVCNLGKSLGSIDSEVQIKAIDMAIIAIDDILARVNDQNAKEGKMYRRLGILGGVLITVVLL
ncbi:MAG: stage III sporulation protein AB [Defluviitaleaceae bacterium]|nr:stage III sporulation protein AB [Defluviitaleaceae bacterium]